MSFQDFVSATELNELRKDKRESLMSKLRKAKDAHDRELNKEQKRKERGEDVWILPNIEERIKKDADVYKASKNKKKKKKHKSKDESKEEGKKHKKKKKKAKVYQSSNSSASNSSDDGDDDWVEADSKADPVTSTDQREKLQEDVKITETPADGNNERDNWMMTPDLLDYVSTSKSTSREDERQRKKMEEKEKRPVSIDVMGQHERELNPYWKNGGSGLPTANADGGNKLAAIRAGDGGKSWIRKAYERAQQQAEEQGRDLEDIVVQRWGSMDKLQALLNAAERKSPARERERGRHQGWRKRDKHIDAAENQSRSSQERRINEDRRPAHAQQTTSTDTSSCVREPARTSEKSGTKATSHIADAVSEKMESNSSSGDSSADSSGQSDEDDNVIEVKILSTQELNKLGARIMKAELMGDEDLVTKLKKQLEASKRAEEYQKNRKKTQADEEEIVLMQSDKHGNLYPLKLQDEIDTKKRKKRRREKKIATHDAEGKRVRYFEGDDKTDLKTLVKQERLEGAETQHLMAAKLANKFARANEDYTLDDIFEESSAVQGRDKRNEERKTRMAIADHHKWEKIISDCPRCFSGSMSFKHLIIAMGAKVYLTLPSHASLTDGHCQIVPMEHILAASFADEDVLLEIQKFKQSLTSMYAKRDMDVIFTETFKQSKRHYHMYVDCIPVPKESGDVAPIYFKKAILESEKEWSQNRKLVDIKKQHGIRKAVPVGLPYFAVEFGMEGGYAHVIEEVELFPHYFAKEVVGGILDLDHLLWRKPAKETFQQHKTKVLQFAGWWQEFDWTRG